jgi:FtsZ-binding cell division protein ZapB
MEGHNNNDEEKLLNFCKIMLTRVDMEKKFKKTDKAILLKLLNPKIPDKVINSYKKNNNSWKEDSLLRIFDDCFFNMFMTGMKIQSDRLDPSDDAIMSQKIDYRYMDHIIRGTVDEIKELQKEIDDLKDSESVPEKEYYDMMADKDREILQQCNEIGILERKLADQRKHFEAMIQHERKTHNKLMHNLENQIDKMAGNDK